MLTTLNQQYVFVKGTCQRAEGDQQRNKLKVINKKCGLNLYENKIMYR